EAAVVNGRVSDDDLLTFLMDFRPVKPPEALLRGIVKTLTHRYYGLESLALASVIERAAHTPTLHALPDIASFATSSAEKVALGRVWLGGWRRAGFWLGSMPLSWWKNDVTSKTGKEIAEVEHVLNTKAARKVFEKEWVPKLLTYFAEATDAG